MFSVVIFLWPTIAELQRAPFSQRLFCTVRSGIACTRGSHANLWSGFPQTCMHARMLKLLAEIVLYKRALACEKERLRFCHALKNLSLRSKYRQLTASAQKCECSKKVFVIRGSIIVNEPHDSSVYISSSGCCYWNTSLRSTKLRPYSWVYWALLFSNIDCSVHTCIISTTRDWCKAAPPHPHSS